METIVNKTGILAVLAPAATASTMTAQDPAFDPKATRFGAGFVVGEAETLTWGSESDGVRYWF